MSLDLPERVFREGETVWTPPAGVVVLQRHNTQPAYPEERLTDGIHQYLPDGRFWHGERSRSIFTREEYERLIGVTEPTKSVPEETKFSEVRDLLREIADSLESIRKYGVGQRGDRD